MSGVDETQPDPITRPEPQPGPTTLPAVRAVAPELDGLARVGTWLAAAESRNPDERARGAAAALRLYVARELGLSPIAGLKIGITPKGEIILPASLYRDLADQRGYRVARGESSPESVTAFLVDKATGEPVPGAEVTFTMQDAERAGLNRAGSGYESYPERMLWARASKWLVEDFVPGLGFALSDDEAQELAGEPVVGAPGAYEEPEVVEHEEPVEEVPDAWDELTDEERAALQAEAVDVERAGEVST